MEALRKENRYDHTMTRVCLVCTTIITACLNASGPSLVTAEYYAKSRQLNAKDVVAAIIENRVSPKGVQVGFHETPDSWEDNLSHYLLMSNAVIYPRKELKSPP